jgi:hypothetical protein
LCSEVPGVRAACNFRIGCIDPALFAIEMASGGYRGHIGIGLRFVLYDT